MRMVYARVLAACERNLGLRLNCMRSNADANADRNAVLGERGKI